MPTPAPDRSPRLIVVLALALLLVSGLGHLASQTFARRPDPGADAPLRQYVPAPAPVEAESTVAAGEPVGPARVDGGWLSRVSARTDIPPAALRAYARVQLERSAGCDVGWTTLAGIGWIESQHGTLYGRRLRADGTSTPRILGPALDGRGDFAAIPATPESSAWHGDPRWEHALGPMQFIPSTWRAWATDGDGDGRSDPHDLDDAAAAAGRYLCADGRDLATGEAWTAAVFSYNHAQVYVDAVHEAASSYAVRAAS